MKKLIVRIVLIVLVLAIAAVACVNIRDGNLTPSGSLTGSSSSVLTGPDATATYGAEQFYLQLTAVAEPDQK